MNRTSQAQVVHALLRRNVPVEQIARRLFIPKTRVQQLAGERIPAL